MEVRIKKLDESAVIPKYSKPGDAGMDLVATSVKITHNYVEYGTGLAFEVPEGFVGLIYPRSSLSNYDLVLANSVGVLDSGYRGEVKFRFKKTKEGNNKVYEIGDRIGQIIIVPYPKVHFVESNELSSSERGVGGYGSTGTK